MARAKFGGRLGDTVVSLYALGSRKVLTLPVDSNGYPTSVALTVWTAQVAGARITDLLAADGVTPIAQVVVPADGQIPVFFGPNNIVEVWLQDPDGDRYRIDVGPAGPQSEAVVPARLGAYHVNDVPGGNWDNAVETGAYAHTGATNAPEGSTEWHKGWVTAHTSNWITQEVHRFTSDAPADSKTFMREKNNGVFTQWVRVRKTQAELDARYNAGPLYSKITNYAALVGAAATALEATAGPYAKDGATYDPVLARYVSGGSGSILRAYGVDRNGLWTRSFWYKRRGATDTVFDVDIADNPAQGYTATATWQRLVYRGEISNLIGTIRFSDVNFPVAGSDIYIFEDSLTFGGQPAPPDTTWLEVGAGIGAGAFQNGWVNHAGAGEATVGFRKIGNRVDLKGMAKNGTLGAIAFTLPVGFRPPSNIHTITASNGSPSYLTISAAGDVSLNGSTTWVSLARISFLVD